MKAGGERAWLQMERGVGAQHYRLASQPCHPLELKGGGGSLKNADVWLPESLIWSEKLALPVMLRYPEV